MATVAEILKASGFTDDQIAALDARAITAFTGVLTTAEQQAQQAERDRQAAIAAKEATELAGRSNTEFYETKIVPGLVGWEQEQQRLQNEKANAEALAAFYKAQNEGARTAGFIPADAPAFTPSAVPPPQQRANNGQYVAGNSGGVPGSPSFDANAVAGQIGNIAGALTDLQWKYQSLYGKTLPIAPSQLIAEADAQKLSPGEYAARKFNFQAREAELAQQAKEAHETSIREAEAKRVAAEYETKLTAQREEFATKERQRAEQASNNPDVKLPPGSSKMAEVRRAVEAGTRPDPLKMTDADRRQATRQAIHSEIAERQAVGA